MICKSLLPLVFLINNHFNFDVKNGVAAGAHELMPFQNSWYRSVEKNQQIEETPNHISNYEAFAEFPSVRPRKPKAKDAFRKKTDEYLKKSHDTKKKRRQRRKRKKKPVPSPRRFVKAEYTERDKESNMTESIEVTKRSKPVDIIVHIKVSE